MLHILSLITIITLTPITIKIAQLFYDVRIKNKGKEKSD